MFSAKLKYGINKIRSNTVSCDIFTKAGWPNNPLTWMTPKNVKLLSGSLRFNIIYFLEFMVSNSVTPQQI